MFVFAQFPNICFIYLDKIEKENMYFNDAFIFILFLFFVHLILFGIHLYDLVVVEIHYRMF